MATPNRAAAPVFRAVRRYPRTIRLPAFRGSYAVNQRINILMPLGVTYEAINFRATIAGVAVTEAQWKAQVVNARAIIDGDDKLSDASITELIAVQQFWNKRYGLDNVNDGVFRLDLSRPWEQEIDAQDGPAWGCAMNVPGGVGNFTWEFQFAGAGVTIDAIEAWAEVTDAAPLGRHWCLRRYPDSQAAAGEKVFSDFNQNATHAIYAIHIDKASTPEGGAPITDIKLKVDQVDEIEKIPAGALENIQRRYGLIKQTGFTQLAFAKRGRPLEAFPLVAQDMRLSLFTGAALNNYNILCEQLEGVEP